MSFLQVTGLRKSYGAVTALDLDPHDDIQASGAVKKHLAGVLLRRVAVQLMEQQP